MDWEKASAFVLNRAKARTFLCTKYSSFVLNAYGRAWREAHCSHGALSP